MSYSTDEIIVFSDLMGSQIETSQQANEMHASVTGLAREVGIKAARLGEYLKRMKQEVRHGKWEAWVEENLEFSSVTAWRYMKVYSNLSHAKEMSVEQAYKLLCRTQSKEKGALKAQKRAATAINRNWKAKSASEVLKVIQKLATKYITAGTSECAQLIKMLETLTDFLKHNHADATSGKELFIGQVANVQAEFAVLNAKDVEEARVELIAV